MDKSELIFEPQALAIDGGDVRRGGGNRDPKMSFDQMLAEGGGVGGTAARTGHDELRRPAPAAVDQFGKGR